MSSQSLAPQSDSQTERWVFDIGGMDCADCARTIEVGVGRMPGVESASINFPAATLTVTPASGLTREAVTRSVAAAGYAARPRSTLGAADRVTWWQQRRTIEICVASLLWLLGFLLEHQFERSNASSAAFIAATLLAGYPIFRAAIFALRNRRADMHVLMSIAAIGAIAIGEYSEAATVAILFATGIQLQATAIERTRRSIRSLLSVAPATARVLRDWQTLTVPVDTVQIGEQVVVLAGERIPVDGVIEQGESAIDQSSMTGESIPVNVVPGSAVMAGTMNGDGVLQIVATSNASDTTLARVIGLVEEAESSRAPAQAFVDRFAAIYTPAVVGLALLLATVVPLWRGDFEEWVYRALVLLVVACPCALVISTPVALVTAIGAGSRRGVLFKGGAAIEALAGVQTVAFDKTGTLTTGHPVVKEVFAMPGVIVDKLLANVAAISRNATHPISRGIVRAANERHLVIPEASETRSIAGQGVVGSIEGERWRVGNQRLLPEAVDSLLPIDDEGANTTVYAGSDHLAGAIQLADPLRTNAARTIDELHGLGLETVMLTGDQPAVANRIGAAVGVDDVRAGLLPGDKLRIVAEMEEAGPVAMIGDGINDAPALTRASVGVAMGISGADVAIEASDVALMRDDISQLPFAVQLARKTLRTIHVNVAFSLVTKVVFLVLTVAGVTNLWLAVLADTGASLLVTLNSLRLLRNGQPETLPETRAE